MEQWGSGVQRMVAACREARLPDPVLEEIGTRFRVTIYSAREAGRPPIDEIDESLLQSLQASEGLSTRELAERVHRTPRAVRTRLARLWDSDSW